MRTLLTVGLSGWWHLMPDFALALRLLQDGASYGEAARTINYSRYWLAKKFPGYGWTHRQGGAYGGMVRHMNERMRRV